MTYIIKKHLTLIFIFNSLITVVFSQTNLTQNLKETKGINVKEDSSKPLNFLHNTYKDGKRNYLPLLLNHIKVNAAIPTLALKNPIIRALTATELEVIKEYKQHLTSTFATNSYIETARFETILYTEVVPIRFNQNTSTYEYLESYTADWDYNTPNTSLQLQTPLSQKKVQATYATSSVLATGKWYKIGLTQDGVYKIDKAFLISLGIDVTTIDPRNIRIYGNGGKLMAQKNSVYKYDDLLENAISVVGENDAVFDDADYALFYGRSTDSWKRQTGNSIPYEHEQHTFSDTSFYYITVDLGLGKRIITQANLTNTPTKITSQQDFFGIHEINTVNVVKSGTEFFGEKFDLNNTYSFSFNIPDASVGDSVYVKATVLGRADVVSTFGVNFNSGNFNLFCNATSTSNYIADIGYIGSGAKGGLLSSSTLGITISKLTSLATGWLDKIQFNCRRNLVFSQNQFTFRDRKVVGGAGSFAQYNLINNSAETPVIWDVTNPSNVKNQLYASAGSNFNFIATADSLKEFVAFTSSTNLKPIAYKEIPNQNLHAIQQADFIIVTHPLFIDEAKRIAKLHQDVDSLSYVIATTQEVYNEFSSGTPDMGAIREFTRMLYKRPTNPAKAVQYLLLLGDGSYKNRELDASGNSAFIPTYETFNSTSNTNSFVSDDYFAMMDDNEGDMISGKVDVGVGRFPVRSKDEAKAVTNKIEHYYLKNYGFDVNASESSCANAASEYPQGDWRNWVTFVADDEDATAHIGAANNLGNSIALLHKNYNVDKIFADSYLQYSTPGGDRYPDAVIDINRRFDNGCLIFNYTGHGGEVGLGSERFVEIPQILKWKNKNNLPLMVTATCEFSRFDDPNRTSAGELCLLNPDGGAIGLLTTARVAFTDKNDILNGAFFDCALIPMANGKMPHIGDLYRLTKCNIPFDPQYFNFIILGDPALKLAYPEQGVFTSSINSNSITPSSSDTLKGLSKITITGFVGDKFGNKNTAFNGVVFPTVFDKEIVINTLRNDAGSGAYTFNQQKNIIYKGKSTVVNGEFTFSFLVPKDISFNYGKGKISYYAHNGVNDANGYYDKVIIGGSNNNAVADNNGPTINLYMNDEKFVVGGTTNENPKIYAVLSDSSGINTLGTGIGHDAVAVLDETSNKPIILNDFYTADLNTYQKGKIRYPFNELAEGKHTLSVKVWDVQNNSSAAYTDFYVSKGAELALAHILNYPNPFTTKTKFFIEHNQCCTNLKVLIQIYTITGKVVKSINQTINNDGFRLDGIEWDGKDEFGDKLARGVYVYKVSVTDNAKKKAEKIEKLVILN
jgi:Peptidase family C25